MSVRQKKPILLLAAVLLIAFGCGSRNSTTTEKNAGNAAKPVIRLTGGDWGYPTPYAHYPRGPGGFKMCLIFDSLLERGPEGIIPWLAKSWTVSPNGCTYTFRIRGNVTWHDGTPLTAKDVEFSLKYASQYPAVWSQLDSREIKTISTEDAQTVVITTPEPNASLLYRLGRTRLIPEHIWAEIDRPREFTGEHAVIGSGPFRLTHYNREQGIYRFEPFEDFWGPKIAVNGIQFIPVSQEILAFENGTIDLAPVPPDTVKRIQSKAGVNLLRSPGFWGYRLLFNPDRKPLLGELEFRKALAYAINRHELVNKVARGAAQPGNPGILPPDHRMYDAHATQYAHDQDRARRLLQSVLERKKTAQSPTEIRILLSNRNREVRLATLIRQQLTNIGIQLKIQSCDGKTRDAKVRSGDYELAIIGHGGWGANADYLYERFYPASGSSDSPAASGNRVEISEELAETLIKLHKETDNAFRRELVIKAQHKLAAELPELPLYYTTGYVAYRPGKYDGWTYMYDHHSVVHSKLSYLTGWE